jgi:hypothetical protein
MATSAKDIAALEKIRRDVKKETYKALLEQFSRKIRTSYDLGRKDAILTVPPFVVGFPKYDISKAVVYMCRQLQKLGYTVELVGPIDIRVRWLVPKFETKIEETEDDLNDILPGLVNLQKTAQKLRITKKK